MTPRRLKALLDAVLIRVVDQRSVLHHATSNAAAIFERQVQVDGFRAVEPYAFVRESG